MYNMRIVSLSFTQGITKDYPRDSLSVILKKPVYIWVFWAWKYLQSSIYLDETLLLITNRYFKLMILVLIYIWEDARTWRHWNSSLDTHFNCLGAHTSKTWNASSCVFFFSLSESLSGCTECQWYSSQWIDPCGTGGWVHSLFYNLQTHTTPPQPASLETGTFRLPVQSRTPWQSRDILISQTIILLSN